MRLLPAWAQQHTFSYTPGMVPSDLIGDLRNRLSQFHVSDPEVSIIIPAYNEEKSILNMLSSMAHIKTKYRTELIVANNNSKDNTQALLDACGVRSVLVLQQGIGFSRQAALQAARGKFVINADCDCLYPPSWVDSLIEPLKNELTACTYGTYSFLPSAVNSRQALMVYETASQFIFAYRRWRKVEFVNVMGFNFAFRREDGLSVGGFKTDFQRGFVNDTGNSIASEDGWMALSLLSKGRIKHVTKGAHVWSSDRVLAKDGGVLKAFKKRVLKELSWLTTSVSAKLPLKRA